MVLPVSFWPYAAPPQPSGGGVALITTPGDKIQTERVGLMNDGTAVPMR